MRRWSLSRQERPLQGTDDAPFEIMVPDVVIVLEVAGDLNTLHPGVHDLPPLIAVAFHLATHLVYYGFQRLICVMDEGGLPPLRVPLAV